METKSELNGIELKAMQIAIEDIDGMSDEEIAEYLGIDCDEVNYQYRNDAIDKKIEELIEFWKSEGIN